jgi:hypothetical protein
MKMIMIKRRLNLNDKITISGRKGQENTFLLDKDLGRWSQKDRTQYFETVPAAVSNYD